MGVVLLADAVSQPLNRSSRAGIYLFAAWSESTEISFHDAKRWAGGQCMQCPTGSYCPGGTVVQACPTNSNSPAGTVVHAYCRGPPASCACILFPSSPRSLGSTAQAMHNGFTLIRGIACRQQPKFRLPMQRRLHGRRQRHLHHLYSWKVQGIRWLLVLPKQLGFASRQRQRCRLQV